VSERVVVVPPPAAGAAADAGDAREQDVSGRVVRGGAARGAAFVAGNLFAAAASVFLLRHLGVVEFGRYTIVMALVAIVSGVTDAGLTATAARDLARVPPGAERHDLTGQIVGLRGALTVAGVLIATVCALVAGYDHQLVVGTLVAGSALLLVNTQAAMLLPLTVDLRNGRIAASEVTRQALTTVGIIALVVAGASLSGFFWVQIGVGATLLLLSPVLLGRGGFVRPRFDFAQWRALARTTLPLAVAFVLAILYFRLLVVVVSLLSSDTQTGYFATSFRIFEMLVGLPLLLNYVVLPVLSRAAAGDPGRVTYVQQRMTELGALCGLFIAVVAAVAAEPIIVVLGGAQFRPAAGVLQIQVFALVFVFLTQAWGTTLIAHGEQRKVAITGAIGLVAVLGLGFALVGPYGAKGAAVAALISEALLAGTTLAALRSVGPGRSLRAGLLPRVFGSAAIASLALIPVGPAAVRGAIAAALFGGAAMLLGAVPPEVLDAVRLRRRSRA
jgi:O-antigen/teichoic acid export membrane protein